MCAVDVVKENEVIACLQKGQVDQRAGGHARGADDAVLGSLHLRDLLLDNANGWVVVAMIGVPVDLAIGDLFEHIEGCVVVVDGVDYRRHHRLVAVWGQGVRHSQ